MLEAELEEKFRQGVRQIGGMVVQLAPTLAGVPDRLVLHRGRMYLVELKTEEGVLSPIQEVWHRKARRCGVPVVVLHGESEVAQWVDWLTI